MNPNPSSPRRFSGFHALASGLLSILVIQASLMLAPLRAATIDLANTVIVQANSTSQVIQYAAQELKTHLELTNGGVSVPITTGTPSAGKFPIYVGTRPTAYDTNSAFITEEARWVVTGTAVWLYGQDSNNTGNGSDITTVALNSDSRTGSLWAVYEFLENHVGIRWVEPGANGTICLPKTTLSVPDNTNPESWVPQLTQRRMRYAYADSLYATSTSQGNIPAGMGFSAAEFQQRQQDEQIWQRRHRRGNSANISYGHAFQSWWEWYNPTSGTFANNVNYASWRDGDLFALYNGNRRPANSNSPENIKLCVSNPKTAKRVAIRHFYRNAGTMTTSGTDVTVSGPPSNYSSVGLKINSIENDGREFCQCADCMALDVVYPGEESLATNDRHMTDRYVYFVNRVYEESRKLFLELCANPQGATGYNAANVDQLQVYFYAYSAYNRAPRREIIHPNIFLFLLNNLGTPLDELNDLFAGWKAMGANEVFHRPNDLCQDTAMPIGFEEHMFAKYRLCATNLVLKGTDYDTCWGFWPTSGIANYIMMRAMYRPEKDLAYWENEYFSTFGNAASDIREYHTYWRQIWNMRIMNNIEKINAIMDAKDISLLRTKVTHLTDQLYTETDYDLTDAMLDTAVAHPGLTAHERARIENLQLSNQHQRLKFRAVRDNCLGSPTTDTTQKKASTQALHDFRLANKYNLNINWANLYWLENVYEDNTGTKRLLGTEEANRKTFRETTDVTITANRKLTNLANTPAITSISPSATDIGDTLTINGTHFYDIASIEIGGVSATTWTRLNPTTITAVVPVGAPVSGSVTVTNLGGDSTNSFKLYYLPGALDAPSIATHPVNQLATDRANTSFTVVVNGSPAPICQWQSAPAGTNTWTDLAYETSATLTLTAVTAAMDGNQYRCSATNSEGSVTSNAASLTVRYAPSITAHPANVNTIVGSTASFSVTANGNLAPAYQWQSAPSGSSIWTDIAGATLATLAFTPDSTAINGNQYRCVATNPLGSATSNAATITVTDPGLEIAQSLKTQLETAGSGTITVTGPVNLGRVGGASVASSGKTIIGADADATISGNLTVPSAASNTIILGITFDGGSLTINGASDVVVTHCTFADSPVAITGNADNVALSWNKFTGAGTAVTVSNAGATTGILFHHNLWGDGLKTNMPNATYARVHMYNNYFTATGNTTATVAAAGAQILSERNIYQGVNNPLTKQSTGLIRALNNFTNATTGTTAPGTDTVFVPDYSRLMYPAGIASPFDAAAVAALITDHASNTAGRSSVTPAMTANATATIAGPATVLQGDSFTLTANATGFSPATARQWYFDNFPIDNATGATYAVASTATTHTGAYSVELTTPDSEIVTSGAFRVTLITSAAPVITTHPASQNVNAGASVTFNVVATGSGLTYQWQKNSANISGATSQSYAKSNVQQADAGDYRVIVTNVVGNATSNNATLIVITDTGSGGNTGNGNTGSSSSGGGGAVSLWYLTAALALALARLARP